MTREEVCNSMTLQDAIQVFRDTNAYGTMDIAKNVILKALEQKIGHWIEHKHGGIEHIECSECGIWFLKADLPRKSYCPNCGSCNGDMIKNIMRDIAKTMSGGKRMNELTKIKDRILARIENYIADMEKAGIHTEDGEIIIEGVKCIIGSEFAREFNTQLHTEHIIKSTIKEYIGEEYDDVTELLLDLSHDLCERIRKGE